METGQKAGKRTEERRRYVEVEAGRGRVEPGRRAETYVGRRQE
jgi:hypothetical protein